MSIVHGGAAQATAAGHAPVSQDSQMNLVQYSKRKYRPLDVHSWGEAYKVTIGWLLVALFAVITGILLPMYELKVINKGDRDLRDMVFDYRITSTATNYFHKHFINGDQCCNWDPAVFGRTTNCLFPNMNNPSNNQYERYNYQYEGHAPYCPPLLLLRCPDITSNLCNSTRAALYSSIGLTLSGQYHDCTKAGRFNVGAEISVREPDYSIAAYNGVNQQVDELPISPLAINQTEIQSFVDQMYVAYGNPEFVIPEVRLREGLSINGVRVPNLLFPFKIIEGSNGFTAIKNWPVAIFDFPGLNKRCPNTLNKDEWQIGGVANVSIPLFDYDRPNTMVATFSFLNDSVHIPLWKVQLQVPDSKRVANPQLNYINVSMLNSVEIHVGMTAVAGACNGWFIDSDMMNLTYLAIPAFIGTIEQARALTTSIRASQESSSTSSSTVVANNSLAGGIVSMEVVIRDVSAPIKVASPPYYGMWYIVFTFGAAAVWTWSLGPYIVFILPLIWWNVRSNKGMPPVVYRYMEKYRGW